MSRQLTTLSTQQVEALTLATEPYLSCEQCFQVVDAYVESVASGRSDDAPLGLKEHLAGCAACADEADSLLELVRD